MNHFSGGRSLDSGGGNNLQQGSYLSVVSEVTFPPLSCSLLAWKPARKAEVWQLLLCKHRSIFMGKASSR